MWLGTRRTLLQKAAETAEKCIFIFSCSFFFFFLNRQKRALRNVTNRSFLEKLSIAANSTERFVRTLRPSSFRSSFAAEFSFTFLFQRPNRSNLRSSMFFRKWCHVSLWRILSYGNDDCSFLVHSVAYRIGLATK